MVSGSEWLGLATGAVIGGLYGAWQVRDMKRRLADPGRRWFTGVVLRLALVLGALFIVLTFLDVDRYWLIIGLAAAYTGPLVWGLTRHVPMGK
ncbi:MAG TPA: hypothetical protein VL486_05525 [Verrucomicrobiae bacterium]|nr:hypothetical protein [Verrucomicrobiae bacterium]